jgi:hypothetical protein
VSGQAIDASTRLFRRGSGHGTSEMIRVIGGDPSWARVATSTSRIGGGPADNDARSDPSTAAAPYLNVRCADWAMQF